MCCENLYETCRYFVCVDKMPGFYKVNADSTYSDHCADNKKKKEVNPAVTANYEAAHFIVLRGC